MWWKWEQTDEKETPSYSTAFLSLRRWLEIIWGLFCTLIPVINPVHRTCVYLGVRDCLTTQKQTDSCAQHIWFTYSKNNSKCIIDPNDKGNSVKYLKVNLHNLGLGQWWQNYGMHAPEEMQISFCWHTSKVCELFISKLQFWCLIAMLALCDK